MNKDPYLSAVGTIDNPTHYTVLYTLYMNETGATVLKTSLLYLLIFGKINFCIDIWKKC